MPRPKCQKSDWNSGISDANSGDLKFEFLYMLYIKISNTNPMDD